MGIGVHLVFTGIRGTPAALKTSHKKKDKGRKTRGPLGVSVCTARRLFQKGIANRLRISALGRC